jgi:hypothetical protein
MHLRDLGLPDLIVVLVVAALLIWGGKLRNVFRTGLGHLLSGRPILCLVMIHKS